MKKSVKLLSILCCIALLYACIPFGASAMTYDTSVACRSFQDSNSGDLFGDGTVKYDYDTNTITLNNFQTSEARGMVMGQIDCIACEYSKPLNIEVIGENYIDLSGCLNNTQFADGIYTNGSLHVYGPGSITVIAPAMALLGNDGVWAKGDILIENEGTFSAIGGVITGGSGASYRGGGVRSKEGTITFNGPKKLEFMGQTAAIYNEPVYDKNAYDIIANTEMEIGGEPISAIEKGNLYSYFYVCMTKKIEYTPDMMDVNSDLSIDMKDVLALRKAIAQTVTVETLPSGDVNGDGEIDMKDVLALRKYIADPNTIKVVTPPQEESSEEEVSEVSEVSEDESSEEEVSEVSEDESSEEEVSEDESSEEEISENESSEEEISENESSEEEISEVESLEEVSEG